MRNEVILWSNYLVKMSFAYIKNREIVFWIAYALIHKETVWIVSMLILKMII